MKPALFDILGALFLFLALGALWALAIALGPQ